MYEGLYIVYGGKHDEPLPQSEFTSTSTLGWGPG